MRTKLPHELTSGDRIALAGGGAVTVLDACPVHLIRPPIPAVRVELVGRPAQLADPRTPVELAEERGA